MPTSNVFNWSTAPANYSSQLLGMNQRKHKNQHTGAANTPTALHIVLNKSRRNQQHPEHRLNARAMH